MTTVHQPAFEFVVDASVAVKWLLTEPDSAAALTLFRPDTQLHLPDLAFSEVANILWKRVRNGDFDSKTASRLLRWLIDQPLVVHGSSELVVTALTIACSFDRTVYDSIYLALAIREDKLFVTADEKLYNSLAATSLAGRIILLSALSTILPPAAKVDS